MLADTRNNMQMVVTNLPANTVDIPPAVLNSNGMTPPHKQGVMLCREVEVQDKEQERGESVGNSAQRNFTNIYWMVMVPKHLTPTISITGSDMPTNDDPVTPPYRVGEIIYCQRLDVPVVLANGKAAFSMFARLQNHPAVQAESDKSSGRTIGKWSKIINEKAASGHYGTAVDPVNNMVFWFDLNVDGRSRVPKVAAAGTSGTSGTAQNVWL